MHLAIFDIIDSMKDSINGALIIEQETTLDSVGNIWPLSSIKFHDKP